VKPSPGVVSVSMTWARWLSLLPSVENVPGEEVDGRDDKVDGDINEFNATDDSL
jgi:hypothetical protein